MRILVVGAGIGGGHMSAAQAVAARLCANGAARQTVVVEDIGATIRVGRWSLGAVIDSAYSWSVCAFGGLPHRALYSLSDRYPAFLPLALRRIFARQLRRRVLALRPDIIVSTVHILSSTLSALFAPSAIPVVSVITDAGRVSRLWLSGRVHHFVFTDTRAAEYGLKRGLDPTQVSAIRNVIAPDSSLVLSKTAARRILQLPGCFTVLVTGGLVGFGPHLPKFLMCLNSSGAQVQLLLAPGRNRQLGTKLAKFASTSSRFIDARNSLLPYMAASDVVVGKAGWLTLTEASTIGRPTFILNYIKGQEDENVRVACADGSARLASPEEAAALIEGFAQNPSALTRQFPGLGQTALRIRTDPERLEDVIRSAVDARVSDLGL